MTDDVLPIVLSLSMGVQSMACSPLMKLSKLGHLGLAVLKLMVLDRALGEIFKVMSVTQKLKNSIPSWIRLSVLSNQFPVHFKSVQLVQ